MGKFQSTVKFSIVSTLVLLCLVLNAHAVTHYNPGTLGGYDDAELPPPGWNPQVDIAMYSADKVMGDDGKKQDVDFNLDVLSVVATLNYATEAPKLFGARLGSRLVIPYVNEQIDVSVPGVGLVQDDDESGIGDISFAPLLLGWGGPETALSSYAGFSIGIPTGSFDENKTTNVGKGFWSLHLEGGARLYLDQEQKWWTSAVTTISINGDQKDTKMDIGDEVVVEYGVGRIIPKESLLINPALVGFGYWKLDADEGATGREVKYALGPELSLFVLPKNIVVKLRALYEFGVENGSEGRNLTLAVKYTF